MDTISIVVVQNKDVFIALGGCEGKCSGLVGPAFRVDFPCIKNPAHDIVRFDIIIFHWGSNVMFN